jgi:transposase
MNVPNKFIKTLTDSDYNKLVENYQTSANFRVRNRSHAILLSYQKYSIDEIAKICQVHRTAVSRWIDWWNELGLEGLADLQRNGREPILTLEEQAKAIEIGLENPKFPHRQLSRIKQETGKEISSYTLKRLLKKRLFVEKNQIRFVETRR